MRFLNKIIRTFSFVIERQCCLVFSCGLENLSFKKLKENLALNRFGINETFGLSKVNKSLLVEPFPQVNIRSLKIDFAGRAENEGGNFTWVNYFR